MTPLRFLIVAAMSLALTIFARHIKCSVKKCSRLTLFVTSGHASSPFMEISWRLRHAR